MLLCPHCAQRTFETEATDHTRLLLTGCADGDVREEPLERLSYTYGRLLCCHCRADVSQEAARDAFDRSLQAAPSPEATD